MGREEKEWGGEIEGKWEREEDWEEGEGVKETGKESYNARGVEGRAGGEGRAPSCEGKEEREGKILEGRGNGQEGGVA